MGYPEAQRGDFGPGVPDEQEGELDIWGQQEWRVLWSRQVRSFLFFATSQDDMNLVPFFSG
jgi:hypothetical protein